MLVESYPLIRMLIRGYDIQTLKSLHSVALRIVILKSNKIGKLDRESNCAVTKKVVKQGIICF